MKNLKLIIIAATCFLSLNLLSQAQEKNNRFVQYGYFGIEGGYMYTIEDSYMAPSLTLGFKKGFEVSAEYKFFKVLDPNSINYFSGIPFLINSYESHATDVSILSFNLGKSIYDSKKMRVILSAGPSIIKHNGYENSGVNFLFVGKNESIQTINKKTTGLDVKAKFDLTGAEVVGISLIMNGNFNEFQNYYSTGLAFTFGKLK